jgi:undecaprenyl-diphosphatase
MPLSLILFIAAVQGVTEFLPVSSSGHLVLVPVITDQPYQGQSIDVAAHVGTLIAVLVYLRRDVISIITAMLGFGDNTQMASNRRLGLMIAAGHPAGGYCRIYGELCRLALADIGDNAGLGEFDFCRSAMGG